MSLVSPFAVCLAQCMIWYGCYWWRNAIHSSRTTTKTTTTTIVVFRNTFPKALQCYLTNSCCCCLHFILLFAILFSGWFALSYLIYLCYCIRVNIIYIIQCCAINRLPIANLRFHFHLWHLFISNFGGRGKKMSRIKMRKKFSKKVHHLMWQRLWRVEDQKLTTMNIANEYSRRMSTANYKITKLLFSREFRNERVQFLQGVILPTEWTCHFNSLWWINSNFCALWFLWAWKILFWEMAKRRR